LAGIVMTMFDPRTKLSSQVVEEVQRFFGDLVYDVIIPRTVRLSEAPGFGQPITVYDPRSRGAQTYRQLAAEVASRPPPAEPMPVFDDLPTVVVPPVVDAVTPEPVPDEDLEALPVPTVHEVVEEFEAEVEVQADARGREDGLSAPEPPSAPEPAPSSVAEPVASDAPAPKAAIQQPPAAQPVPQPVPDEDDVWEDSDEPSPSTELPPQARERRPSSAPAPPEHLPERRVVVIDEDAELRTSSRPTSEGVAVDEPATQPAVASIGATLEEEGHGKRRWRLFRKGGE
jgi:hypothetical protein